MQNINPASTGAAKAVGEAIPVSNKKLSGMSKGFPVLDVNVVDLTARTTLSTFLGETKSITHEESKNTTNIPGVTEEEAVSSDFTRDSRSRVFDVTLVWN